MFNKRILLYFVFVFILQFQKVVADSCDFYQGSTSIIRTCDNGCCENVCCTDDYKTLAIILGVVFGCLILLVIIIIIVICLTRNRWSKKIGPQKDKWKQQRGNDIELAKVTRVSD